MKTIALTIAVVGTLAAGAAHADIVGSDSLQIVNGSFGDATATTTTDATGRSTSVTGPAGSGSRATATPVLNSWFQTNIGVGSTVGITSTYAHDGNGSASFATTAGTGKADLEYYFGSNGSLQPIPLASLASASFDFYRSSSSMTNADFAPVFRLDIAKNGVFAGSLVFENVYQQQQPSPVDSWTTLSATLNSGIFWATNASLGPTFASANGGQKTLQDWINANGPSTLSVYGMSIGVGSGWSGTFAGAVDDVAIDIGSVNRSFNFEVSPAAATVPEPATLALTLAGLGALVAFRRRAG